MSNTKVVQDIYAAFGRGDIQPILDKLADNVDWDYAYRHAPIPFLGFSRNMARRELPASLRVFRTT